ncbi:MAG: hypothetical protein IKZ49_04290 [Alphaproteobacteria bacterium]|nr:hypothetical protein [Alphaproteobacteria bacterium]
MTELVVHGVVDGQEVSKCDENANRICGGYYIPATGIRSDIKRLPDNRMAYSLLFYEEPGKPFVSYTGRSGSYFGMTLFLQNQQVANPDDLFKVLLATYNHYVKGKFIQEMPNGGKKWMCPTLNDSDDTVATYIGNGFQQILNKNAGLLKFQPLPPLQHPGRSY